MSSDEELAYEEDLDDEKPTTPDNTTSLERKDSMPDYTETEEKTNGNFEDEKCVLTPCVDLQPEPDTSRPRISQPTQGSGHRRAA